MKKLPVYSKTVIIKTVAEEQVTHQSPESHQKWRVSIKQHPGLPPPQF